jgi:thymidine phosphorylase
VLEAQDVMAVLSNDSAAPRDLREKSLRLAARVLEYDPELRGGSGYARARELVDNGAALKQMHKIIEAQRPSACNTDIGTLSTDILAPRDGVVEEIDCLRLNRLARTAGAPIDKGAGIKLFKKVGDHVEQGEPLYRIHAFDDAQFDLARTGAKADDGYVVAAHSSDESKP